MALSMLPLQIWSSLPGPGKQLTIAFYNLENLFDTQDDPAINDEDFLPSGANEWTDAKKNVKMSNLARVINQLGDEDGPEILGVCEVENRGVLEELAQNKLLKKKGYGIVHIDSKDERGIDCALLYKKKRFTPLYSQSFPIKLPDSGDKTRDVLLVKGIVDGKNDLTLLVNHWPSRRGGEDQSAPSRMAAAQTVRSIVDSILDVDPLAGVVIMGDLNDDPNSPSLIQGLKASGDTLEASKTRLYNTVFGLHAAGNGTLKYKGKFNLFDQMVVSSSLISSKGLIRYVPSSAGIYNPLWMRQTQEGDYKDAPKRTYIGKKFQADGFSDHFPVYIHVEY
jgi:predicted extracellular nuclease